MAQRVGGSDRRRTVIILFTALVLMTAVAAFAIGGLVGSAGRGSQARPGSALGDTAQVGPSSFPSALGQLGTPDGDSDPGSDGLGPAEPGLGPDGAEQGSAAKVVAPTTPSETAPSGTPSPTGSQPPTTPSPSSGPSRSPSPPPPSCSARPTTSTGGGGVAIPVFPLCG